MTRSKRRNLRKPGFEVRQFNARAADPLYRLDSQADRITVLGICLFLTGAVAMLAGLGAVYFLLNSEWLFLFLVGGFCASSVKAGFVLLDKLVAIQQ